MTEKKETPQEIDLIDVFSRIGNSIQNGFSKIGQLFVGLFNILVSITKFYFKNALIIIGFLVIGLVISKFYYKTQKDYYRSIAFIESFTIPNANLIDYINNIHTLAKNNDSIAISNVLGIAVSDAGSIKDLEAFWLIDKNKDGIPDYVDYKNAFQPDTITKSERITSRFTVELLSYDPEISTNVQMALEKYLNSYPQIEQIVSVKKENLNRSIKRLSSELIMLDSLKGYEYFQKEKERLKSQGGVLKLGELLVRTSDEKDVPTRLLHTETISINEQINSDFSELELKTKPFQFITKFAVVNNPVNQSTENKGTIKFFILFFILGSIASIAYRYGVTIYKFMSK